jgi:hypothetical protein
VIRPTARQPSIAAGVLAISARIPSRFYSAASVAGFIALSATAPISTTRFQFDAAGHVVLPVRVDGASRAFVMDTAARDTTINPAVAATLARQVRDDRHGIRVVDDVSLELLGVVLPHQVLQLSTAGDPADGVVGAELCNRFVVKVDFRGRRITLWERSSAIETPHAVVVPADFSNGVPIIKARVGAAHVKASPATLIVGLTALPGTVGFTYRYGVDAGFLDASRNGELPIEIVGVAKAPLPAVAHLPREPERGVLLFGDGIVSARALTSSWIVFEAPLGRILIGQ